MKTHLLESSVAEMPSGKIRGAQEFGVARSMQALRRGLLPMSSQDPPEQPWKMDVIIPGILN